MEDEKRREIHTIPTIQYTSKVQWRPNRPYQLAASFKDESTVQVFDVRRPYVPLHVLSQHDKDATSILWKDSDVLWTVSKDKTFASTLVKGQTISADLLPGGKAAMNCYGQLAFTVSTKAGPDSFERDLVPKPGRPNAKAVALDGSSEVVTCCLSFRFGSTMAQNHELANTFKMKLNTCHSPISRWCIGQGRREECLTASFSTTRRLSTVLKTIPWRRETFARCANTIRTSHGKPTNTATLKHGPP